ncbi:multicopper oxidase family protein [Streptomyces sp. TRM72054]|uniref:multicopper oxidase family protein n=1 Tax=Streptomyces sp. TRM72054 TaxID=2870562 RepID=UPI001C8BA3DD|nr:multicopper oxidase family protein [Streptomyces sp. TRM72054]MBX9394232.1 multicopper oxidase family protein [Streptomyces sp. TRM72054]
MNSLNRRSLLLAGLGVASVGTLAACSGGSSNTPTLLSPSGSAVARAEKKRRATGTERKVTLTAAPVTLDLGGVKARTWAYGGQAPGKEIRISAGDTLVAELSNQLPDRTPTSVHWHGLALRSDMDGVPMVTQRDIRAGSTFTYRFIAADPGTHWFHPHSGLQLDRGLYAPLIVEDPKEPLSYDDEWVIVLDDWLDGVTGTPDEALAELRQGMADHGSAGTGSTPGHDMSGHGMGDTDMDGMSASPSASSSGDGDDMSMRFMLMGATSDLLGGDAGDVKYPYHLINGKVPADPDVYTGKPGRRVRMRFINAGGDTAYRVALGGHRMTVTHTDGYPVEHRQTDALLIGMGERYDVLVTLGDGVFPLVALAEGKDATGLALVRTGSGSAPSATVRPKELNGTVTTASALKAAEDVRLPSRKADVVHRVELTGGMEKYDWAVNGRRFDMANPDAAPFLVEEGQRVRLDFVNTTEMWHPMHLHGHTFQLGGSGARKDTTIVLPKKTVSVVFDADNPGQWMLHCHNVYHGEVGMMALVAYRA